MSGRFGFLVDNLIPRKICRCIHYKNNLQIEAILGIDDLAISFQMLEGMNILTRSNLSFLIVESIFDRCTKLITSLHVTGFYIL